MFKRLKTIKDLLWAAAIGVSLLFLFVGFVTAAVIPYHGDRTRPVMDLRSGKGETKTADAGKGEEEETAVGLNPDGTLHPLAKTADAGQDYIDSLTFLCDSSFIGLRGSGLTSAPVWSSETGMLSMSAVSDWTIRYPGDSSYISPASAAMVARPKLIVIAVGSDGLNDLSKERFTEQYAVLIRSLSKASPEAAIVCLSLPSVTSSYLGTDGLSKDKVNEVNGWIKSVCIETGAYYGELSETLCEDGWLRSEYADGSGRALNSAGLREVLNYLRDHSMIGQ